MQQGRFYSQKGESLSPSGVGLGRFWVLVDLSTVVVTPPTCFYYLSYYLSYYLYGVPVTAENREGSVPVTAWKTGPNHQKLWINLVARVAVGTPRSYFQRPGGSV